MLLFFFFKVTEKNSLDLVMSAEVDTEAESKRQGAAGETRAARSAHDHLISALLLKCVHLLVWGAVGLL